MLFRKKKMTDDMPEIDGKVIARISVDKVDRRKSKIKAYAVSRETGATVYKLRYEAQDLAELACYYQAEDYLKKFIAEHDYILDGKIQTNIKLPYVGTLQNKSGYGR